MNIESRYLAKVVKSDGCWVWPGKKNRQGYGIIRSGSNKYGTLKETRVHRLSWEIHHGAVPEGLCVLHRCDNPECSNPDHLFLGTFGDNNRDRAAKGRTVPPRGEKCGFAKLNAKKAAAIRALSAMGISKRWLGMAYGVTADAVAQIRSRKTWAHVACSMVFLACSVSYGQNCPNGKCRYAPGQRVVQAAAEITTATAQGVANIIARDGRLSHRGGNGGMLEGIGMGSSPDQALRNCCYSNSGRPVVDQGVAYGHGRWWACKRYR